jgi:hypothetical protein
MFEVIKTALQEVTDGVSCTCGAACFSFLNVRDDV